MEAINIVAYITGNEGNEEILAKEIAEYTADGEFSYDDLLEYLKKIGSIYQEISKLSQEQMCRLWRFSSGHHYFQADQPYWRIFKARFDALGGFTPEISKRIGW